MAGTAARVAVPTQPVVAFDRMTQKGQHPACCVVNDSDGSVSTAAAHTAPLPSSDPTSCQRRVLSRVRPPQGASPMLVFQLSLMPERGPRLVSVPRASDPAGTAELRVPPRPSVCGHRAGGEPGELLASAPGLGVHQVALQVCEPGPGNVGGHGAVLPACGRGCRGCPEERGADSRQRAALQGTLFKPFTSDHFRTPDGSPSVWSCDQDTETPSASFRQVQMPGHTLPHTFRGSGSAQHQMRSFFNTLLGS